MRRELTGKKKDTRGIYRVFGSFRDIFVGFFTRRLTEDKQLERRNDGISLQF
jgi:hypothetical protein